jgi:beta-1,4-galactosyltransferase 1
MNARLAVIIPFRDRHAHLWTILPMLGEHLAAIPHTMTVVEQADDKPFNRGKLLNVGAVLAADCDYYCFHDVDLVPAWRPGHRPGYRYTRAIAHMVGRRLDFPAPRCSPNSLGGVVLFARRAFEAINGFSNEYWGWGQEDNDLYARAVLSGVPVAYRPYRYRALAHPAAYRCDHRHWGANCARYDLINRGSREYLTEGLSSLSYDLVSRDSRSGCDWIEVRT